MAEIKYFTEEEIQSYYDIIIKELTNTFNTIKTEIEIPEILTVKIGDFYLFYNDFYKTYHRIEKGIPDMAKYDRLRMMDINSSEPPFVCMYDINYKGEKQERVSIVENPCLYIITDYLLDDMISYRVESYTDENYFTRLKNVYTTRLKYWIGYLITNIINPYHNQPYTEIDELKNGKINAVPIWKNEWKLMFNEVNIELGENKNKICSYMKMDMILYQDVFAFTELMSNRKIEYV